MAGIERTGGSRAMGIGGVPASAASRALTIIRPEMVTSKGLSFNIMNKPVTVAMFRQFVEDSGYKIKGHYASELIRLLAHPKKSDRALTYVSREDATAFIAWRKETTGQDLRMPTEDELLAAHKAVGDQLTSNLWEWTQTYYNNVIRVLRASEDIDSRYNDPDTRFYDNSFRLVVDK